MRYHEPTIKFIWDPKKASSNLRKHGISFEEASTAFVDDKAVQFFDDLHSDDEDRFILLGMSQHFRLLTICHCEQASESTIRLISARRATVKEQQHYQGKIYYER